MAQLLERLLPTVHGSNPVIRKNFIEHLFTVNCIEIDENKEKEAVNGPLKKLVVLISRFRKRVCPSPELKF